MAFRRFFYHAERIATVQHDAGSQHFSYGMQDSVSEVNRGPGGEARKLLKTDFAKSVIEELLPQSTQVMSYSPYGYAAQQATMPYGLGFNGELRDILNDYYHLGIGHRSYSTTLMRFVSSDSVSPFGRGGVNAYCYCIGDPVNHTDPRGQNRLKNLFSNKKPVNVHSQKANIEIAARSRDVTLAGRAIAEDARARMSGVELLKKIEHVDVAYRNIARHLDQGDIFTALEPRAASRPKPSLTAWATDNSINATIAHHDAIMRGTPKEYHRDWRLSSDQISALDFLNTQLRFPSKQLRPQVSKLLSSSIDFSSRTGIQAILAEQQRIRLNLERAMFIY